MEKLLAAPSVYLAVPWVISKVFLNLDSLGNPPRSTIMGILLEENWVFFSEKRIRIHQIFLHYVAAKSDKMQFFDAIIQGSCDIWMIFILDRGRAVKSIIRQIFEIVIREIGVEAKAWKRDRRHTAPWHHCMQTVDYLGHPNAVHWNRQASRIRITHGKRGWGHLLGFIEVDPFDFVRCQVFVRHSRGTVAHVTFDLRCRIYEYRVIFSQCAAGNLADRCRI